MPKSTRAACAAVLVTAAVVLTPVPASAGQTVCTYDTKTRTISVQLPNESSGMAVVRDSLDAIDVDPCNQIEPLPPLTVYDVDKIVVEGLFNSYNIGFDLSKGPLAPGYTNEVGTSDEIEVEINIPSNGTHEFIVEGSVDDNGFAMGSTGVNLNANESSGLDQDVDIDIDGGQVTFLGGLGNDSLLGAGGFGTGEAIDNQFIAAGGSGNDLIEGGLYAGTPTEGDILLGGRGRDTLTYEHIPAGVSVDMLAMTFQETGGAGKDGFEAFENLTGSRFADELTGSNANNVVKGLKGNDGLLGASGDDSLNGGKGADDECVGGPGTDTFAGCETKQQGG